MRADRKFCLFLLVVVATVDGLFFSLMPTFFVFKHRMGDEKVVFQME